jgi:ribonuclease Z
MLDCGEGTQHRLLNSSIKPSSFERIFITHLHGDHCYGIFGFLSSLAVHGRKDKPFYITGPKGIAQLVNHVLKLSYAKLPFPIEICELPDEGDDLTIDGWQISARSLSHRTPSYGYVLQEPAGLPRLNVAAADKLGIPNGRERGLLLRGERVTLANGNVIEPEDVILGERPGRKVVLLGDTKNSEHIHQVGSNCDILVHEATFEKTLHDKAVSWGHSTTVMAGECAQKMSAKHLILTHFSSRYPDRGEKWDAQRLALVAEAQSACSSTLVHAAQDGWRAHIGPIKSPGEPPHVEWFDDRTGLSHE